MKNKKTKKILFSLILGLLLFNSSNVYAAKTITGKFERSEDEAAIGNSGLPSTHYMYFTDDKTGKKHNVYCSWYERSSPPTANKITFTEITAISENNAVGIAYILNTDIGYNETKTRVIKTAAINIYLSMVGEKAGYTEYNRYNGSSADTVNKDYYPIGYYIIKGKKEDGLTGFRALLNFFGDCENSSFTTSGVNSDPLCANNKQYYKKVYDLVTGAQNAAASYQRPTISFENKDEDFTLSADGRYYTKTYKVNSSAALKNLSATVTGVDQSYVKNVVADVNAKTIYVRIDASGLVGNTNDVKVVASATTTHQRASVYTAAGSYDTDGSVISRADYQDVVMAGLSQEYITISTEDKIDARTCYSYTTVCESTACTNQSSERNCWVEVQQKESSQCSADDLNNTLSGKKQYELIENTCSLYCKEIATVKYPGNVTPAVTLGTNFTWPTSTVGGYPLTTESKMTCKIEMHNGSSVTQACKNALINKYNSNEIVYSYNNNVNTNVDNNIKATLTYNDTKTDIPVSIIGKCSNSGSIIDGGSGVEIKNSCSYTLDANKYIAVNKKTLKYVDEVKGSVSNKVLNYILVNYKDGVLPINGYSWTDTDKVIDKMLFSSSYKLEISNLPLGYGKQFTSELDKNLYVCNYKVTTDTSAECACPVGSKYSTVDLYGEVKEKATTCAEAKEIYCNADKMTCDTPAGLTVDITNCLQLKKDLETCKIEAGCTSAKEYCPPGTSYAGYDYENDDNYKACIFGGGTKNDCIAMVCNCGSNCEYTCSTNTCYPGKEITTCVYNQRGQGKNLTEAIASCEKALCSCDGENIIYRTISLENPFPSKDADASKTGNAPSIGLFNDTVHGRYPGTNWNSVTLVYNRILNNRGYDGSEIYEANPLYTINLDPTAIKQIREYNKKQEQNDEGYADFTLRCTDGAYCISSFLHGGTITMADGTPILDSNAKNSTCASANDKDSFVSCYTYK